MDTHTNEPKPSNDNDSTDTLDNQSCNTPESLHPEATGSKSEPSTNEGIKILQDIVKSSDRMTIKQHKSTLPNIFKHIMRGTQTPLTLIGVTMSKYNEEGKKPEPPIQETSDSGKTEISVALNPASIKIEEESSASGAKESLVPSTSVRSSFSQFRVEAVTVKFSHEAATQATPPHPSLTSAKSAQLSRDVLQIATSVSSNRSGQKSEVLTVTTDYSARSPDERSLLLDVIDEDHPIRYINVEPSTPAIAVTNSSPMLRSGPGLPQITVSRPSIDGQISLFNMERRRGEHRWKWRNCFRRNTPQGEEPDVQPYSMGPPPTYSGIFMEPRSIYTESRFPLPPRLSNDTTASFITPIPPPSYAQAQSLCVSPYSMEQLISVNPSRGIWSARPTATICPRCTTVVITAVETRRSAITHISALGLFLCGCWPCCLIPYCIDSCQSTHHYCPVCRTYLGTYTPW